MAFDDRFQEEPAGDRCSHCDAPLSEDNNRADVSTYTNNGSKPWAKTTVVCCAIGKRRQAIINAIAFLKPEIDKEEPCGEDAISELCEAFGFQYL